MLKHHLVDWGPGLNKKTEHKHSPLSGCVSKILPVASCSRYRTSIP